MDEEGREFKASVKGEGIWSGPVFCAYLIFENPSLQFKLPFAKVHGLLDICCSFLYLKKLKRDGI